MTYFHAQAHHEHVSRYPFASNTARRKDLEVADITEMRTHDACCDSHIVSAALYSLLTSDAKRTLCIINISSFLEKQSPRRFAPCGATAVWLYRYALCGVI